MLEGKYIFKLIVIAHIKTGDISDEYISKGLRVAINISNFIYIYLYSFIKNPGWKAMRTGFLERILIPSSLWETQKFLI